MSFDPGYFQEYLWIVILAFVVAFVLAFAMGANDCANSYGPAVGSGVLTLLQAYLCATVFEVLGAALLGYKVTNTIRKNIVNVDEYDIYCFQNRSIVNATCKTVPNCSAWSNTEYQADCHTLSNPQFLIGSLGTLIGCAVFLVSATVVKMPVSTTHSIIGATVGFSLVLHGGDGINWVTIGKIVVSWVISPLLAGLFAIILYIVLKFCALNRKNPLESSLKTLPFLFFLTLFINIFSVLFGGSKFLKFDLLPAWADVLIALIIGCLISAIVWFTATARIRRSVLKHLEENEQVEQCSDEDDDIAKNKRENVWTTDKEKHTVQLAGKCSSGKEIEAMAAAESNIEPREIFYDGTTTIQRVKDVIRPCVEPSDGSQVFASLQILSSCFLSFTHGSNDTANSVGPLVALWITFKSGYALGGSDSDGPLEGLILFGALSMIVGLWVLGHKVIKTVGKDLSNITPASGFCVQMGSGFSVLFASQIGIPISTTHCIIGAIVILGWFRNRTGVSWKLFGNIAIAWLVTLPIAGGVSALATYLLSFAV